MSVPDANARNTWQDILDFYESHYGGIEGWEYIAPFRDRLVARIAASPYVATLFASQTHQSLLISLVAYWPEQLDQPYIVIWPGKSIITAGFHLPPRGSKPVETVTRPLDEAWDAVEPMLVRLANLASSATSGNN